MTNGLFASRSHGLIVARVALISIALASCTAWARSAHATDASTAGATTQTSFIPNARLEDDDPRLLMARGWRLVSASAASGRTRHVATRRGAYVRIRFRGTGVSLVSRLSPIGGVLEVSVDGTRTKVVDMTRTSVTERARVWTAAGLPYGVHNVFVRSIATSPTTAWRPPAIDAFLIQGTPLAAPRLSSRTRIEETDRRIRFLGSWRNRTYLSTGSRRYVSTAKATGARAVVTFRGTGIAWLAPSQAAGTRVRVVLDGRAQGYVAMNRSGRRGAQRVMWSVSGLRNRTHTLTLTGVSRPSSSSKMTLDVFEVEGAALEAAPRSTLGYGWSNYIVIDKSEFRIYLVRSGRIVRTYPIATGRFGMTTPSRVWRVGAKYHTSPGSVYGPRKLRLFKRTGVPGHYHYSFTRYGVHGTNQPWVIGTRASHGCIRLYNADILDLFPRVPLYTMVVTRD